MAEESHISKRHKTSETHTQHDLPQGTPIGEDLDPQIQFPSGEEELKQDGDGKDDSEGEQNSFRVTDTCKILDDHLNLITSNLPEFKHRHALVSANLLGEVDKIEDSREKNKAFQHLRVSLKNIIPQLNSSKASLQHEISQLQITISSLKDLVDIHKAKVTKQGKLLRDALSHSEDADLTFQVDDLKVELEKLQEEHAMLDQDYQTETQKLEALTANSAVLEQFQQQQMQLQQQQYQAYLQQQQQLQYPVQQQHQPPPQYQPQFQPQYQPPPQYQPQYQPQFSPQGYPPQPQYGQPPPQYHGQQYEQQSSHQMEQGGGADGSQPGFGRGWGKSSPVPSRSQRGLNMEEDEDRRTL